jgi:hypothetical protein
MVIALAAACMVDCGLFQVRMARASGLGSVPVEQYLSTPLKGNKAEYDYLGTTDVACAHSLFPQYARSLWNPPCWWLEKHRAHWL